MNLEALENLEYNTSRTHLIIPENGRHFQKMIDSGKGQLACDVWMVICLGLNVDQLKKVFFVNNKKKAAKIIKIKDDKKEIIRYIPSSLLNLI